MRPPSASSFRRPIDADASIGSYDTRVYAQTPLYDGEGEGRHPGREMCYTTCCMMICETAIPEVMLLQPRVFRDARGYFTETYHAGRYREAGIEAVFVQDNESCSMRGVIRGLHWQVPPYAQAKLTRVIRGAVLDVAVDIREGSATFGQFVAVRLSAENGCQLYIPRGFAHGFAVLEDETIFAYKCDNVYHPESERGMRYDDPALGIPWPDFERPILSERDCTHPLLAQIVRYR